MGEAFIKALISILVMAACVFGFFWVLDIIGLGLPSIIIKIVWAVFALLCLLVLFRLLRPYGGNWLP